MTVPFGPRPGDPDADHLNTLLDAMRSPKRTPDAASPDLSKAATIAEAARQFRSLVQRADAPATAYLTRHPLEDRWEDIMHTAYSAAPSPPGEPAHITIPYAPECGQRSDAPPPSSRDGHLAASRSTSYLNISLSALTTAALIAIIGVAGFGLLRDSFDFLPNQAGPDPAGAPGIAASPEANSVEEYDCDTGGWVSVFTGAVPTVDAIDTALLLDDDGTLSLVCDTGQDVVASGVRDADARFWPGVVAMVLKDDTVRLLNLNTGRSIDLQGIHLVTDGQVIDEQNAIVHSDGVAPWLVTPANVDHTDWRLIDLRAMESFLLSDDLGGELPRGFTPSFGVISGLDVAVVTWHEPLPNLPSTPQPGGTDGIPPLNRAALVLPGSIGERRWIEVVNWGVPNDKRFPESQVSSISRDGSLLAYTTMVDGDQVIRVEDAKDGSRLVDVPLDENVTWGRFLLTGEEPRLVYSDRASVRVYALSQGTAELVMDVPETNISRILPTADPGTVLLSHNDGNTSVTPLTVTTGERQERYAYVPPAVPQLFGSTELPQHIVRVVSDAPSGVPATVQLVDPVTGEVVLGSDPIDVHPLQIIASRTFLRDGGSVALVPVGDNRTMVMDAATGEVWEIEAPGDHGRRWLFSLDADGELIIARPEPLAGTPEDAAGYIRPVERNAEWVSVEQGAAERTAMDTATPQAFVADYQVAVSRSPVRMLIAPSPDAAQVILLPTETPLMAVEDPAHPGMPKVARDAEEQRYVNVVTEDGYLGWIRERDVEPPPEPR